MALLYGRAGRLNTKNAGFRPGQTPSRATRATNLLGLPEVGQQHEAQLIKVLLADFGEAKQLTQSMTRARASIAGTPLYMAPEMREADEDKGPKVCCKRFASCFSDRSPIALRQPNVAV